MTKTNVMRILDAHGITYAAHEYDNSTTDGETVARMIGKPADSVFKTLVTEGSDLEEARLHAESKTTAKARRYAIFMAALTRIEDALLDAATLLAS